MKIIDRYILTMFVKNYLISFMTLIGLYIALDMVFNFGDLVEGPRTLAGPLSVGQILSDIGNYYWYQSFLFFVHLSGVITVVAAAFTLVRLSRFNELTALLAAGTPLLRVAASVIIAGAVLDLFLAPLDQQVIIPQIIPKLIRTHGESHGVVTGKFPIQMMQAPPDALVNAAEYSPPGPGVAASMRFLDVIEIDKDLQPTWHLTADAALWDESAKLWRLKNGYGVPILKPDQTRGQPPQMVATYAHNSLTPEEIALYRGGDYLQLLPFSRVNQLLQRHTQVYGRSILLRTMHYQVTGPLTNVILLLLAIPSVLTRQPGSLRTAAVRCMGLCAICMATVFVGFELCGAPPNPLWVNTWPAVVAWIPIFLFAPLSVLLLDRVKT